MIHLGGQSWLRQLMLWVADWRVRVGAMPVPGCLCHRNECIIAGRASIILNHLMWCPLEKVKKLVYLLCCAGQVVQAAQKLESGPHGEKKLEFVHIGLV